MKPEDISAIVLALIAGMPATLIALATLISSVKNNTKTSELAKSVNGHMTNLLEHVKIVSKAEGKVEGVAEGIVKGAELNKTVVIPDRRDEKSVY